MRRLSLHDVRTRLLAVVVAVLAIALAAVTAGFNALLTSMSSRDANALLRERAASERSILQIRGRSIHLTELSDDRVADSRIWIFAGSRAVARPRAHPDADRAAQALTTGPSRYITLPASDERLFSSPVFAGQRRVGTIVAGVSLAPYEHTAHVALIASMLFAASLLLVVGGTVWWLLRSALRPVAQMTDQAAAWVDGGVDGRFRLGEPHDELTRLAWTLDQLLDRIAASLRHERLLSAELSHELRTPLARLRAEAELALRRPRSHADYAEALRTVIAQADGIDRLVAALLAAAREDGPRGISDAGAVMRATAEACAPLAATSGIEIEIVDGPAIRVGVDEDFAERVLHPILDNACRYADTHIRIASARAEGEVVFTISDDGPGVLDDERESIFEPATRGSAGRASTSSGAGLGLALARRLSRSVGGDVVFEDDAFVVRLPAG